MDVGLLKEGWGIVSANLIPIVLFASIFIEVTPVKWNPLSMLMEFLLKSTNDKVDDMNKSIAKEIDQLKEQDKLIEGILNQIKEKQDQIEFKHCRWEILAFSNSIHNGIAYTEQEYQHIFESIERYTDLHEKYKFTNGYTDDAIDHIKSHHDENKDSDAKYF